MTGDEDQLRGALHRLHGTDPEPLDPTGIIAGARRRQARNRARMAAATCALAVVALAGVLLPGMLRSPETSSVGSGAAAPQKGPAATPTGSTTQSSRATGAPAAGPRSAEVSIRQGQWCIPAATPSCHRLDQTRAEVEISGTPTLVVLAPVGTDRIEPVRPGGRPAQVLPARGEQDRLVALQPLAGREPVQAVAADGRVLATW